MNIEKMKQILKRNASDPWFMDNQWIYFGPMDEPIESSANYVIVHIDRTQYHVTSYGTRKLFVSFDKTEAGMEKCLLYIEKRAERLLEKMRVAGASEEKLASTDFFVVI
jgi:hypothetical protein